jgi:hypothetical protein
MATGSYEESLSIEGIPDQKRGAAFTRGVYEWSRRSSASSDPYQPSQKEDVGPGHKQLEGSLERREDVNHGGRDRGVRGSIASASWEENAHARYSERRETRRAEFSAPMTIRRSGLGRRETSGPPEKSCVEP